MIFKINQRSPTPQIFHMGVPGTKKYQTNEIRNWNTLVEYYIPKYLHVFQMYSHALFHLNFWHFCEEYVIPIIIIKPTFYI